MVWLQAYFSGLVLVYRADPANLPVLQANFFHSSNTKSVPEILLKELVLNKCCLCKAQKIHYCRESEQWKLLALVPPINCSLIHTLKQTKKTDINYFCLHFITRLIYSNPRPQKLIHAHLKYYTEFNMFLLKFTLLLCSGHRHCNWKTVFVCHTRHVCLDSCQLPDLKLPTFRIVIIRTCMPFGLSVQRTPLALGIPSNWHRNGYFLELLF